MNLMGSIKTKHMTVPLLTSKCSQTVESVADVSSHLSYIYLNFV